MIFAQCWPRQNILLKQIDILDVFLHRTFAIDIPRNLFEDPGEKCMGKYMDSLLLFLYNILLIMFEEKEQISQNKSQMPEKVLENKKFVVFPENQPENIDFSNNLEDQQNQAEKSFSQRSKKGVIGVKQKGGWTIQQEQMLIALHNQKGNKWVQIARQLHKNDNEVKNHYHAKVRKALRKINRLISQNGKPTVQSIKSRSMSRIIQTSELYYSDFSSPSELSRQAYELKNRIIKYSELIQQNQNDEELNQITRLLTDVQQFNRNFQQERSSRNQRKSRKGANRYKGMEIMKLIKENQERKDSSQSSSQQNISRVNQIELNQSIKPKPKQQSSIMNPNVLQQSQGNASNQMLGVDMSQNIAYMNGNNVYLIYNYHILNNQQPQMFVPIISEPSFTFPSFFSSFSNIKSAETLNIENQADLQEKMKQKKGEQ